MLCNVSKAKIGYIKEYTMLQTNDISTLGAEIKSLINNDRTSALKRKMFDGVRYYDSQHDILKTRMLLTKKSNTCYLIRSNLKRKI